MKICIDLGNDQFDYITVFENDSPTDLAEKFSQKHGIGESL